MSNYGIIEKGPIKAGVPGESFPTRVVLRKTHKEYVVHTQVLNHDLSHRSFFRGDYRRNFTDAVARFNERIGR